MTPLKKDEINRVIAEATGLHCTFPDITDKFWYKKDGYFCSQTFNSVDSISDALDAVDVICVSDTVPFQYAVKINKMNDGTFKAAITTYTSKKEYGFSEVKGTAETRPAAVSLALYEYIKEK